MAKTNHKKKMKKMGRSRMRRAVMRRQPIRTHTYLLIRIREIIRYMPAVMAISELLTEVTAAP